MKTGKYSVLGILEFEDLDQFIVPEIQRDYVWQKSDAIDLLDSLKDGFEGDKKDAPYLGFIYAYNDRDYVYKYFLVDGQQRMTTIYLLLMACYQKTGKKLPEYILKQGKLKLDYKVRQATHDFLIDFVNHCQNGTNDFNFIIKDQIWFHNDYKMDKTIINIVENYNAIREWILNFALNNCNEFLKFVEEKVELSYFDIVDGRQGEELYIYMNSRGRQLEPNETLKAKFLNLVGNQTEKEKWGRNWEKWQDFFWKQRGENPDADAGFNDFLQMVQIINMCAIDKPALEISKFASGKASQIGDFSLFPKSLDEIEKYFQAYEWLVNSKLVNDFFEKYEDEKNFFASSSSIAPNRKQIYYFRILPILAFLAKSQIRKNEVIIRFVRFFYNISRKDTSIGKDIANQLSNAIKLMLEYGESKIDDFDIYDLIEYKKGRTVLINDEEELKLSLYKNPPQVSREEIESLFWEAEDHPVFDGEINFLLNKYYNSDKKEFDLNKYISTWNIFESIFNNSYENNSLISKALIYYGNTWVKYTPQYYSNFNCHDWHTVVRRTSSQYILELLLDLQKKQTNSLHLIIKKKAKEYFIINNLTSIDLLKERDELIEQMKVLVAFDYYTENIIWKVNSYIANDERFTSKVYGDTSFFITDRVIHNVHRYIDDGSLGRIISLMKNTLQNENKLKEVINEIVK